MCPIGHFLKSLDQRFPALQEACFKKDLEPKVVSASLATSLMYLFAVVMSAVSVSGDLTDPGRPWRFSREDPRTWATMTKVFLACLAALNIVTCSLRLRLSWLASWNWELQVLAFAILATAGNALTSGRWALLLGMQPGEVFDSHLLGGQCELLALDAIITALCLFVPIRSCVLWVVPVSGLLVHLFMRAGVGATMLTWYDVAVLVILAFFSLVGAFQNERTARGRFLAERDVKVHEERLSCQYLAISRILARFCDCVLELDGDFRFCGPHRQFAAIVFSSASKSLDGRSFLDHLASGRGSFAELLSKNAPLDQASDMLPLLLKDSQGREFAAQAYCACYEDRKGRHYFVGITETQERMPQEACLAPPLLDFSLAEDSTARKPSNTSSRSKSGGSSTDEEPQEVSEKGEISFTFLDDKDYSITSCSPGFTALGGPLSQEQPLRHWMRSPEQLQRLSKWTQKIGNAVRQPLNVILSPPHTERAEVEYMVELSLSCLQVTDEPELAFQVLVEEIRQQKRRRRNRRHRPRSERCGPLTRDNDRGKPDG